jgi:hypothetical protein
VQLAVGRHGHVHKLQPISKRSGDARTTAATHRNLSRRDCLRGMTATAVATLPSGEPRSRRLAGRTPPGLAPRSASFCGWPRGRCPSRFTTGPQMVTNTTQASWSPGLPRRSSRLARVAHVSFIILPYPSTQPPAVCVTRNRPAESCVTGISENVLRQAKSGKGGRWVRNHSETFQRNPAGSQSRPVALGQRPEASFASCAGNGTGEALTASPKAV